MSRQETLSHIALSSWFTAKELESAKEIFPCESGKTYYLPTPYNSYGAAAILAEALATYQEESN